MNGTSGPTSGKQFAHYDPDTRSWRMWPDTGLWGSIEFSETLPRTGYMRDGFLYELPMLAPRITANGSSSSYLPTPTVGNATGTNERRGGKRSDEKLLPGIVLDFLPTPKANDFRDNNSPAEAKRRDPALTCVRVHFPTTADTPLPFDVGNAS